MKTKFWALLLVLVVLIGFTFAQDSEREKKLKELEAAKNQASEEAKKADAEKKAAEAKKNLEAEKKAKAVKKAAEKIFNTYTLIKNLDQPLKDYAKKDPFGRFPEASEEEDGNGTSNLVEQLRDNGFYQFNENNLTDDEPYQLVDAWGNPMRYHSWKGKKNKQCAHNKKLYDLWSAGPDGDFETLVDNVDNWSWINSDEIKLEDIEKHLKVIADSNEIEQFFAEYFKAVNSYEIEKSLEFYYIPEDRLADFKKTASSQMEVLKKMFGEQEFLRNFKLVALVLEENNAKVSYTSEFYIAEEKKWRSDSNSMNLVKIDGKWKIDIFKVFVAKSPEEIWAEAEEAIYKIIDAIYVFSDESKELGALATVDWKPISHILDAINLDSEVLTDLENFDLNDFYYITRKIDGEHNFRVICVAWMGEKRGKSGKGPEIGWKMYDSEKESFSEDYKALKFDGFSKSAKVKEKVKPEEKPEKTEEPKDEVSKEVNEQIAKVLQKFVDSFNARDIEKLLSCFYSSNDEIQKKIDTNFKMVMEAFEKKYKDVEKPLKDPKIIDISVQEDEIYKVTYIIEDYTGLDKDVMQKMLVINIEGTWLIDVFGVYSIEKTMQKMFWKEAKTALATAKAAIEIHKARYKGELPEIFSYEWKKLSEILGKIKIAPDAFKTLNYFDDGDFWYRTFSYKDGNFFEIICLANMDAKGGLSGNGPKIGFICFDERENKWTQDFNAVEYDELKPTVEKKDEEPKEVPDNANDTEVVPEPEDDDEKTDAEKKVFEEIFTKFFKASNSLNPEEFLASIYIPSDSKEEYETNIKTYFDELKKTRKDNEGTFKDWKVLSCKVETEYAVVTIEYKYFEEGKWEEEEVDFTCVKQEKGWKVDVYDLYEIPEKPTEVPDEVKETDKIAELEKTIEKLENEIAELKAEFRELKELIKELIKEQSKSEPKEEKVPEDEAKPADAEIRQKIKQVFENFVNALNETDVDGVISLLYMESSELEKLKNELTEDFKDMKEELGENLFVKDWGITKYKKLNSNVYMISTTMKVFSNDENEEKYQDEEQDYQMVLIDGKWLIDLFLNFEYKGKEDSELWEEKEKAKVGVAKANVKMIFNAIERYKLITGNYPEKLEQLLTGPTDWEDKWYPLLAGGEMPKDPWGNDFRYELTDNEPKIISFGRDGKEGGEGFDADIVYPISDED